MKLGMPLALAAVLAAVGCAEMTPVVADMAAAYTQALLAAPPPPPPPSQYPYPPASGGYTTTPPPAPPTYTPPPPPPAYTPPLPVHVDPLPPRPVLTLPVKTVFYPKVQAVYATQLRSDEQKRFDCTKVVDEFEQLMFGPVLANPGAYVTSIGGKIVPAQFDEKQKGHFRLPPARSGYGIAMLRTSQDAPAKFLFAWSNPGGGGESSVELIAATVYSPSSADTSQRHGTIRLAPGSAVDLDFPREGETPQPPDEAYDVGYRIAADGTPILESLGKAGIEFPTQSLCGEPPKTAAQ